jgi:hypothetical protein
MTTMPRKVLFILGIGRSGSTMLDLMLGSHSAGFSLGEISKIPHIMKHKGTPAAFCPDSTFWTDRFTLADAQQLSRGLSGHRLHPYIPLKIEKTIRELTRTDAVFNPYTLLFDKIQKPLLIDSSKYPFWVKPRLQGREFREGKIQAYICHMVRDGRAVVNSYLRAFPDLTIDTLSERWLNNLNDCEAIYTEFPDDRKRQVRYEVLATDPVGTMQSVCQWLDIPFEPTMLEYWKGDHHYVAGSRSARAMIARYREQPVGAEVEAVHGDYYHKMDLAIKLDVRWRDELSADNLKRFYELIGDRNQPFEWNHDA